MSWTKLAPIAKTSGRPMASASIVVNKDGTAKVSLILSASLKDEFGDPKRCDVLAGSGEHADCLRLEFWPEGAFELKAFVHGGARVFTPVPEGVPGRASPSGPCSVVEKSVVGPNDVASVGYVVLRLPVADWTRASPPSGGSAVQAPPASASATIGGGEDSRLDVVDYLSRKGVKIHRLAGGRFMMAGQTVTMGAVLKAINDHREEAGLTPLAHSQVR